MRKYQPIWEAIKNSTKSKNEASLRAPTDTHTRIIQGVRKEKVKDLSWHLLCAEKNVRYELKHINNGQYMTFYLTLARNYRLHI